MKKIDIFTVYLDNVNHFSVSFHTSKSLFNIFHLIKLLIKLLERDKIQSEIIIPRYPLPLISSTINILNLKAVRLYMRLLLKKATLGKKKLLLFWLKNPEYYFLHNFCSWYFLAFTYNTKNTDNLRKQYFYNLIFKQNLAFIYYINDKQKKETAKVFNLKIDKSKKVIWRFIKRYS